MSILLKAEHVKKVFTMHQFGARQLVGCTDIDFELEKKGDFLGITGRSGAGKSTILKCLYRTYLPTEGRILFESEQFGTVDIASASEQTIIALRKRELGYVSQFLNVLPRITALDVVAHALVETGCDPADADSQARKMLEHFHCRRRCGTLSEYVQRRGEASVESGPRDGKTSPASVAGRTYGLIGRRLEAGRKGDHPDFERGWNEHGRHFFSRSGFYGERRRQTAADGAGTAYPRGGWRMLKQRGVTVIHGGRMILPKRW